MSNRIFSNYKKIPFKEKIPFTEKLQKTIEYFQFF